MFKIAFGFVMLLIGAMVFSFGAFFGMYSQQKHFETEFIAIPKTEWMCMVSRLKDVTKESECVVYRHKEAVFDGFGSRHRKHNQEQGAPLHKKQQTVPRWTWGRDIQD